MTKQRDAFIISIVLFGQEEEIILIRGGRIKSEASNLFKVGQREKFYRVAYVQ